MMVSDPSWFNYLLSLWPFQPEAHEIPQYVLDNMEIELHDAVDATNAELRMMNQ